jgi:hypothetical protein
MNHTEEFYNFYLQTLYSNFGKSDNASITDIQPVTCTKFPHTRVPDTMKPLFKVSLGKNGFEH